MKIAFSLILKVLKNMGKAPLGVGVLLLSLTSFAQDAKVSARMDATQISVGDQARLFIELQHNPALGRVQWANIPDSFNSLEVVERGKIDTVKQGDMVTYRQRIIITGFDPVFASFPAGPPHRLATP